MSTKVVACIVNPAHIQQNLAASSACLVYQANSNLQTAENALLAQQVDLATLLD
jgi:hypothetical protein